MNPKCKSCKYYVEVRHGSGDLAFPWCKHNGQHNLLSDYKCKLKGGAV